MIVAGDLPVVVDRFKQVGLAVAVFVLQSSQLATLRRVQPVADGVDPEHFVQAFGKWCPADVVRGIRERFVNQIDVAATSRHGKSAIGHQLDATGFEVDVRRDIERDEAIVFCLCRHLGDARSDVRRGGEQ